MFRTDNKTVVEDKITRKVYWNPPDFAEIPWFITEMCDFINEDHESWKTTFIHPLIKAMLLHFWIGYLHPFVDGNGRTARALFYRYVLSKNYWLIEYISISRVFVQAPAKYARACLFWKRPNDTTYLHYHHSHQTRMDELIAYINREQMFIQYYKSRPSVIERQTNTFAF
jgi:Fic family protein